MITPLEILPFLLLILFVGIMLGLVIGYCLGTRDGVEYGYDMGVADEIVNSRCRCIQNKRDSFKLGEVTTLSRLANGEPLLRSINGRPLTATGVNAEPGGRQLGNHADPARNNFLSA